MSETDDESRDFTRKLFGRTTDDDAAPDEPAETKPGNYVPGEGHNPSVPSHDVELREFARVLFDRAHKD